MNIEELCFNCARAVIAGTGITLSLPKGARWPDKFPRGELLSVNLEGTRNVSFNPVRVLAWVQQSTKAMQTVYSDFQVTAATQTAVPIKGPL